ncbi:MULTISPECIES: pirin family protein [unclassified Massilia]|uniref:pirin family protein n=1 Tax=unclassified Massilia TaxID=2609279 RepID=UPI00177E06E1|nr:MULTISPECIES: pirin family protein [unclassified Massilia]MBD8533043.1 pirin family protein [Massilia sp. CFBP 13647]MBD8676403.1 pirin family protein [Massilia sp. CFBP 13721]
MTSKLVRRIHPALRDDIGDLVTQRPVPSRHLDQVDPFLFLNHHGPQTYPPHNHGLPFGPHPHRGFETVTFILEGMLTHKDSAGHESIIRAGGVQWMTAGSGLIHAEISPREFLQTGGPLEILQLWINLPPHLKMTQPAYTGLQKEDIPSLTLDEGRVTMHLSAGEWEGTRGPVESLTGVFMSTIELRAGGRLHVRDLARRNVFLYVVRGTLEVGVYEDRISAFHLVELAGDGDELEISAPEGALVLFGHADPIGAPVVSHGPFVMNSRAEIEQAIRDYQAGKFGPPM